MITASKYKTMRKNHRALWQWLSDNPKKNKEHWPKWEKFGYVSCNCFLCQSMETCMWCPLRGCMQRDSHYLKWNNTRSNRSAYAIKIKNAVPTWSGYKTRFPEAISE